MPLIAERVVQQHLPGRTVLSQRSVAGGCINDTGLLHLDDGTVVFLKSHANAPSDMFEAEADGLKQLADSGAIRVPVVLGWGEINGQSYLLSEAIEIANAGRGFYEKFGRSLAELHRKSMATQFGLSRDNYIGASRQPNGQHRDWVTFFAENRIGFQLELAKSNGLGTRELLNLGECLILRLDQILTTDESPCLIHGDLWSGNYLCAQSNEPVLIDPAAYFAHREAEFGMTTLFGGFDASFYSAYNEIWPLPDGSDDRIAIYRLYHLLNHLNLFGRSYLSSCLSILKKYA